MIIIVLGAALVFVAIFLLVMGLAWQTPNPMDARVAAIRGERASYDFALSDGPGSAKTRLLGPMAMSFAQTLQKLLPINWVKGIERRLVMAGEPTTVSGFLIGTAIAEAVLVLLALTLLSSSGGGSLSFVMLGVIGAIGALAPKIWLDNRVRHRQKEILKSLPDAFDLITTCVEAGLGLEAALARVAEKTAGPFGEELTISLHDVALGKLRRDALKELGERVGLPDLTTFINAVIQAESMGTSIAAVLRVQADQMRMKRRQRAEQQAQAAPIKMMFPLVLFIFPTMFLVILGPAGIQIYEQFVTRGQ
ncbi:MAG TPA: type II secretion system F family protein [Dehalococcoidia bacterium]|nr:type II secretion system F family protein [Dehalococcoidia bacterium]